MNMKGSHLGFLGYLLFRTIRRNQFTEGNEGNEAKEAVRIGLENYSVEACESTRIGKPIKVENSSRAR